MGLVVSVKRNVQARRIDPNQAGLRVDPFPPSGLMCYPVEFGGLQVHPNLSGRVPGLAPTGAHAADPVRFRRFTSLNTTIRLREGQIFVSLSDLLEGAPESVIRAIAHILLAKLYQQDHRCHP